MLLVNLMSTSKLLQKEQRLEGVQHYPPHPKAKCFCSVGAWTPGRLKVTLPSPPVQAHTPKAPEASAAGEAKKPELAEPR